MFIPFDELTDIGVDFETYYDDEYSLSKMENAEYIMDSRFEIIGVSLKIPGQPTEWITGDIGYIHSRLSAIDWSKSRMVSHNARFDGSIMEWRLGLTPAAYLCTMVGSRPHYVPYAGGQSLEALARYLGVGIKGTYVKKVKGMHRSDFSIQEMTDYGAYCIQDTNLAMGIRDKLIKVLPLSEQMNLNYTLLKYLRPTLNLNKNVLLIRLSELKIERENHEAQLKQKYGVTAGDIRSRTKFAGLLMSAINPGEMLPTKINNKGKVTFAFAKDDIQFKLLLAHPVEKVRDLVKAKMAFSSTLEESRVKSLIAMCDCMGGRLPVPVVYYGAHTGRLSGDHGINLQNLPRVVWSKDKSSLVKGQLRFAVQCALGYKIIAADFSNIEARIVATLAGQWDLVEAFRLGKDIYAEFASLIYGRPINKDTDPLERFVGKTCILGLGYGMGFKRFHLKMMQEGVIMNLAEATRIVRLYRRTYSKIPELWNTLEHLVKRYCTTPGGLGAAGDDLAGLIFAHERIILPNGMPIVYPEIRNIAGDLSFRSRAGFVAFSDTENDIESYDEDAYRKNLWGGTVLENIGQALAAIIAKNAEAELAEKNLPAALQVHDELVWRVPEILVDKVKAFIAYVMTKQVSFMPRLPVAVEIKHGSSYGHCK